MSSSCSGSWRAGRRRGAPSAAAAFTLRATTLIALARFSAAVISSAVASGLVTVATISVRLADKAPKISSDHASARAVLS